MSRSRKKVAVCGWTCKESEKKDKRLANRKFRKHTRQNLKELIDGIDKIPYRMREISQIWDFAKDGKQKLEWHSKNEELKNKIKRSK